MLEKTILIIKPDSVSKKIVGKIIDILERNSFNIINISMMTLSKDDVEIFYFEHKNKPFYEELVRFMISGAVVVLVLEGINVVSKLRDVVGHTDYKLASNGTIRNMFGSNLTENAVHASDSYNSFFREYSILFKDKRLFKI